MVRPHLRLACLCLAGSAVLASCGSSDVSVSSDGAEQQAPVSVTVTQSPPATTCVTPSAPTTAVTTIPPEAGSPPSSTASASGPARVTSEPPPGMVTSTYPTYDSTTTTDGSFTRGDPQGVTTTDTTIAAPSSDLTTPDTADRASEPRSSPATTAALPTEKTTTTGLDVVETTTSLVPPQPAEKQAQPCGASPVAGFGVPVEKTDLVVEKYSLTPFYPEARASLNTREPDLHRSYVIADGPAGTPAFAVLTADHVRSTLAGPSTETFTQVQARVGGESRADVAKEADVLSYVDSSRKAPIGVVVVDYPDAARVTIRMEEGESVEPILEFLEATDLRSVLEF